MANHLALTTWLSCSVPDSGKQGGVCSVDQRQGGLLSKVTQDSMGTAESGEHDCIDALAWEGAVADAVKTLPAHDNSRSIVTSSPSCEASHRPCSLRIPDSRFKVPGHTKSRTLQMERRVMLIQKGAQERKSAKGRRLETG